MTISPKRPVVIAILCILQALGVLEMIFILLVNLKTPYLAQGGVSQVGLVYGAFISIPIIYGLWLMKKWAFYLYTIASALGILVSIIFTPKLNIEHFAASVIIYLVILAILHHYYFKLGIIGPSICQSLSQNGSIQSSNLIHVDEDQSPVSLDSCNQPHLQDDDKSSTTPRSAKSIGEQIKRDEATLNRLICVLSISGVVIFAIIGVLLSYRFTGAQRDKPNSFIDKVWLQYHIEDKRAALKELERVLNLSNLFLDSRIVIVSYSDYSCDFGFKNLPQNFTMSQNEQELGRSVFSYCHTPTPVKLLFILVMGSIGYALPKVIYIAYQYVLTGKKTS